MLLQQLKKSLENTIGADIRQPHYLIGVSGGSDSVALTHACIQLGLSVTLLHCNYQLRGSESDADEAFVRQLAENLAVPCQVKRCNTKAYATQQKMGTQEAARHLRFNWFNELMIAKQGDFVLLAHHANDQVETFFINLLRGSGIKGLGGIRLRRDKILRPFLSARKDDVMDFIEEHQLSFREDSSNQSNTYLRNRIRNTLLPEIEKIRPGAQEKIKEASTWFQQAYSELTYWSETLKNRCWEVKKDEWHIHKDALSQMENPCFYLHHWLSKYGFHADQLEQLWKSEQTGATITANEWELLNNRQVLILKQIITAEETKDDVYTIKSVPFQNNFISLQYCEADQISFDYSNKKMYLKADKLVFPLILRRWRTGDYIKPLGMQGKRKKVSDVLIDRKLDGFAKKRCYVLTDTSGELLAIPGILISEHVKIKKTDKKILEMTIV